MLIFLFVNCAYSNMWIKQKHEKLKCHLKRCKNNALLNITEIHSFIHCFRFEWFENQILNPSQCNKLHRKTNFYCIKRN